MKNISALIIDDSEIDRYILHRQLNEVGINDIFECNDGQTALEFLKDKDENEKHYPGKFPPFIIFLDINMPLVDGFEFLETFTGMRKELGYHSSIIMMYSSSENPEDQDKAFKYGYVVDFLVKGVFTLDELKLKINNLK